jgi:hypothetical protein
VVLKFVGDFYLLCQRKRRKKFNFRSRRWGSSLTFCARLTVARPPINTSGNFLAHLSAESPRLRPNRSIRSRNRNFSIAIPVLITGTGISICTSGSGPTGTGILHLSSGSGSWKFYIKPEFRPEPELYRKNHGVMC